MCHDRGMGESLRGKLLVASLKLTDPNFARTVVLMCMHDEEGALGVVLNRPLGDEPVAGHLPHFGRLAAEPAVVFQGGPVEPGSALVLGKHAEGGADRAANILTGRTALLNLAVDVSEQEPPVEAVRVFAGYSGWTAGQLEAEIAEEAWFVVEPLEAEIWTAAPDLLWREVLRRQPGKLAMFAFAPADPTVN